MQFHNGNPCWRKITDPPLLAAQGQEVIVLDPDVYFPNTFRFELTRATGVVVMWQGPNCLYPHDVVKHAFERGIRMADHVDFGVCQVTHPLDWEWLDWLIDRIGGRDLPTWSPHVESIVWSALGMRARGGYLDPTAWYCFTYPVVMRLKLRLLKASGVSVLRGIPFRDLKCFHAGGPAKSWLPAAVEAGLFEGGVAHEQPLPIVPFREYTHSRFKRKMMAVGLGDALGIRKLVGSLA